MRGTIRTASSVVAAALLVLGGGCEDDEARNAQKLLRQEHLPRVRAIVQEDRARHIEGVKRAAELLAKGFAVDDAEVREREMRKGLKKVQDANAPAKIRIPEFVASPMSFLAAVGADGVVIARDADADKMKGDDFAEQLDVVKAALEDGEVGRGLGEFESDDGGKTSVSMLFAAPVELEGERVGAVVAGIPLWRMAQRLSNQLRLENTDIIERGAVLWVYLLQGERLFHYGTAPEVTDTLPDASKLASRLEKSSKGFTDKLKVHGRMYGLGAFPLPEIGEGVHVVLVRADPTQEASEQE